MEKKDNKKVLIITIWILAIALTASIIFNIFMFHRSQIRLFDSNLGENIEVEYTENGNFILANIIYPSNLVSDTKYMQKVNLKSSELQKNYFVRAKVVYADFNITNESVDVTISPESDWKTNNDSYYYLNSIFSSWQDIAFIKELTIPKITTTLKYNTTITVYFEFLDSTFDVYTLWDLPSNFYDITSV